MQRRGRERRRFVRVADDVVVELAPIGGAGRRDAQTLNFSAGGVLVLAEAPLPVGAAVRATLHLDDEERPLEFDGRVRRVRTLSDHTHEIAVEFEGGSAGDQRALQDLIAERVGPAPHAPQSA